MTEKLHIPELNRLARELEGATPSGGEERGDARDGGVHAAAGTPLEPRRSDVEEGDPLGRLLGDVIARAATDMLLLPGMPPVLRINGKLQAAMGPALGEDDLRAMMAPYMNARMRRALEEEGAVDLSLALSGRGRFRVNVHRQRGKLAAALRALPRDIPTLGSLNLPASLADLVKPARGLVLVCGPTGSGKSSTLAALVGEINRTRTCHVVTIEDPVEYEHRMERSIIEQVEVGSDTPSFAAALKAALRQDPDVILVGEMRDLETVATCLTAAETGHLILSTLHTNDVIQAIHRIVDVFPPAQQGQIRQQLALALHAIVCQQLLPRSDGKGRLPALELLIATYAVRQHIRKEAMQNLYNEITLGKRLGMITLEESLARLVKAGHISADEARVRTTHVQELESLLRSTP